MNFNQFFLELQKRVAQFRHGTRHPFGLGVSPKHISMEIDALLRRDGYATLSPSGELPPELSVLVQPELAQQTMLLAWRFLHELFDDVPINPLSRDMENTTQTLYVPRLRL